MFEVTYIYHERTDDGFDKENTKEMMKKIGAAHEDVPIEKLAGSIMSQLVRRDIWIVDVEVHEYAKKKIAFKESNGGVVIKGRKYVFEGANVVAGEDEPELAPQAQAPLATRSTNQAYPVQPDVAPTGTINLADQNYFKKKPLRYEIYQPDQLVAAQAKARRLPFTIGKQYPIYEERVLPSSTIPGVSYVTINDLGKKAVLIDNHFVMPQKLARGFNDEVSSQMDVSLDYGKTEEQYAMPSLR